MKRLHVLVCILFLVVFHFPALAATSAQRVISPGGIEAWLVEDHSQSVVALEVGFIGGSTRDPAGKEGLAAMADALLFEGVGPFDQQAFRAELENHGISMKSFVTADMFAVALQMVSQERDTAFDLLRLVLTEPRFDGDAVARYQAQWQEAAKQQAAPTYSESPDIIVNRWVADVLSPGHPYGLQRTPETVLALTAEDLRTFMSGLGQDQIRIGVAGDISADELARRLDETFGTLPVEGLKGDLAYVHPEKGKILTVPADGISQSTAVFFQESLAPEDPDFFAAELLLWILGGDVYNSRLGTEVRQKRGLAYMVGVGSQVQRYSSIVQGRVSSADETMAETLRIICAEWARMKAEGPTARELEDAKSYLIGSMALRGMSLSKMVEDMVFQQILLRETDVNYLETRKEKIRAVTLEQARAVAKRWLVEPQDLSVVLIGNPLGLEESTP